MVTVLSNGRRLCVVEARELVGRGVMLGDEHLLKTEIDLEVARDYWPNDLGEPTVVRRARALAEVLIPLAQAQRAVREHALWNARTLSHRGLRLHRHSRNRSSRRRRHIRLGLWLRCRRRASDEPQQQRCQYPRAEEAEWSCRKDVQREIQCLA